MVMRMRTGTSMGVIVTGSRVGSVLRPPPGSVLRQLSMTGMSVRPGSRVHPCKAGLSAGGGGQRAAPPSEDGELGERVVYQPPRHRHAVDMPPEERVLYEQPAGGQEAARALPLHQQGATVGGAPSRGGWGSRCVPGRRPSPPRATLSWGGRLPESRQPVRYLSPRYRGDPDDGYDFTASGQSGDDDDGGFDYDYDYDTDDYP